MASVKDNDQNKNLQCGFRGRKVTFLSDDVCKTPNDHLNKTIALSWIYHGMPSLKQSVYSSQDAKEASFTASHLYKEILRRYLKKCNTHEIGLHCPSEESSRNEALVELPEDVADFVGGLLQSLSICNGGNWGAVDIHENYKSQVLNCSGAGGEEENKCPGEVEISNELEQVKKEDIEHETQVNVDATMCIAHSLCEQRTPTDVSHVDKKSSSISLPSTNEGCHSYKKGFAPKNWVLERRIFECTRCPAAFRGSTSSLRNLLTHAKDKHSKKYPTLIKELRKKYNFSAIMGSGIEVCVCSLCDMSGIQK